MLRGMPVAPLTTVWASQERPVYQPRPLPPLRPLRLNPRLQHWPPRKPCHQKMRQLKEPPRPQQRAATILLMARVWLDMNMTKAEPLPTTKARQPPSLRRPQPLPLRRVRHRCHIWQKKAMRP